MHNKLILGNWKMNLRKAQIVALVNRFVSDTKINQPWVGIAPPAAYLSVVSGLLEGSSIQLVAQDVSQYQQDGAYTGETNAAMLADIGCYYVLIGHSERRQYFSESNSQLLSKMQNAIQQGMMPVLCVGETLTQREEGRYLEIIHDQLSILPQLEKVQYIVAYEPVWAIGTGKVATVEQIVEIHGEIKKWCLQNVPSSANIRVLYGGSVKADNAQAILEANHVDGALVGGASLDAETFGAICRAIGK